MSYFAKRLLKQQQHPLCNFIKNVILLPRKTRRASVFACQQHYVQDQVIIHASRALQLFHYAMGSESSGWHIAVQIAGKSMTEVSGINYSVYDTHQKNEGSKLL